MLRSSTCPLPFYTVQLLFILLVIVTVGCSPFRPSRSYNIDPVNYEPASGMDTAQLKGQAITIQANEPWQLSGVHVESGDTVKILAMGKWSQAPAFGVWSGPEGLASSPGKEVPWIAGGALMGKIGENGKPFEVGSETELRSTGKRRSLFVDQ